MTRFALTTLVVSTTLPLAAAVRQPVTKLESTPALIEVAPSGSPAAALSNPTMTPAALVET